MSMLNMIGVPSAYVSQRTIIRNTVWTVELVQDQDEPIVA